MTKAVEPLAGRRCAATDGRHLLVGCESGEIKLLEAASGVELKSFNAHRGRRRARISLAASDCVRR